MILEIFRKKNHSIWSLYEWDKLVLNFSNFIFAYGCLRRPYGKIDFHMQALKWSAYKNKLVFTCGPLKRPAWENRFFYTGVLKSRIRKCRSIFLDAVWFVCKNNGVYTKISIVVFCPARRDCTLFLLLIYCTVSSIVFNSGPWIAPSTDRSLYRSRICNYAWLRLRSSSSSVPCTNCTAVYQSH